ncbi:hypothetical protein STN0717CIT72_33070 [Citrobacter portucalensis]|nr:hypothetical protein STN0717CIT72_33070 [Citrobacter portucalensis]
MEMTNAQRLILSNQYTRIQVRSATLSNLSG